MPYQLKNNAARSWFGFRVRGIFDTPPVQIDADPTAPALVSQVCHRDLAMYLLAVKSFARFLPPRAIYGLDDGSLTEDDHKMLSRHLTGLKIFSIKDFRSDSCPEGGTWERLLFIGREIQRGYVVQLDSDTLTIHDPVEVREALRDKSSFTLGSKLGQNIVSVVAAAEAAREYRSNGGLHVQIAAERVMDRLPGVDGLRYVRGCSGFAGFAPDSFRTEDVILFSREMAQLLGAKKWSEWGSEQVTSNFLIANSPAARVLPLRGYPYFEPGWDGSAAKLIHFMGTYRFQEGKYAQASRDVIRELTKV